MTERAIRPSRMEDAHADVCCLCYALVATGTHIRKRRRLDRSQDVQEALWRSRAVGHTEKLFIRATFISYQCDTKVAAFIKAEKQLKSLRAGLAATDLFEIWPCASCFTNHVVRSV